MARCLILDRNDLALLRESLSYMERRIFDPDDSRSLRGITDRIEEILLSGIPEGSELILDDSESRAAATALRSYAQELSHPGSDVSNRRRVARLRSLVENLEPSTGPVQALWQWIRKQFRR